MGIYGIIIFEDTIFGITIYGIMQSLQTVLCRFVKIYVKKHPIFTVYGNSNKKFCDKILEN